MKPWTVVDQTLTADGKTISLLEHDGSYSIRVDNAELMSTRQHASEEKLAQLACAHLSGVRHARVLIGGLGFGFTLQAALAMLPADAAVIVAELLPAVIAWNRNATLPLAADALADARVEVLREDVAQVIRKQRGSFDSIILDVDNGPAALSTEANSALYSLDGLRETRRALRPAGCLGIWSAAPNAAFEKLMAEAGFTVEARRSRARPHAGARHILFLGRVR